ncbi:MAG: hypothetical protein KDA47_12500 [Planctomycetales bacterium]|nr:hypothetical protein [Planctomycetales bacterium]
MTGSILLMALSLVAQAEPAAQSDLAPQVRRLVRQLDDPSLANREAAEQALIDLGPEVIGLLPQVTRQTSAEVKERLGRVSRALETKAAKAASEPTRVTLSGEMTLAEAMRELEKQTGNKAEGFEKRSMKVTTDFDNVTYWEALDQLLDQAGMSINQYGGINNTLTLAARPEEQRDRYRSDAYAGLFRVEATRVEAVRDLRNPNVTGMRVHLETMWEPRMTPISISQPLKQVTATGDDGDELGVSNQQGEMSAAARADIASVEFDLPLPLPDRSVKEIASLKGTLTALVPGRVEAFEFTDLAEADNVEQRKAGVTVVLERMRRNNDVYEVRVRVRFDEANNALESHRGWVYNNEAYVLDADGNKVENAGLQAYQQSQNEVGVAYLFVLEGGPKGCKFVYHTPALIVRMEVPYELKSIPLP